MVSPSSVIISLRAGTNKLLNNHKPALITHLITLTATLKALPNFESLIISRNCAVASRVKSNLFPIPSVISANRLRKLVKPLPFLYSSIISLNDLRGSHASRILFLRPLNPLTSLEPSPILIDLPSNKPAIPLTRLAIAPRATPIIGTIF